MGFDVNAGLLVGGLLRMTTLRVNGRAKSPQTTLKGESLEEGEI